MSETRRRFDPDFKEGAVRIVRETGKPIAQVAGIWGSTRARWATGWPRTVPRTGLPASCPRTSGPVCGNSSGRTPSCGWSVMC